MSDLILVNEDGEVVIGDEPINAAAFAIHSEIHKARPDVHAACHAHRYEMYNPIALGYKADVRQCLRQSLVGLRPRARYDDTG